MGAKGENLYARLCTDEWHNSGMQRPSNSARSDEAPDDTGAASGSGYTVRVPIQQSYNQRLEDSLYRLGGEALVQVGHEAHTKGMGKGEEKMSVLPTEAASRKAIPVATGCIDYFPDALIAVAELSKVGNDQHNPGQPLHWAREKSTDESDALMRHFIERGTIDTDGVRHSAKVAWRALALLQKEIENDRNIQESDLTVTCDHPEVNPFSTGRGAGAAYPVVTIRTDIGDGGAG